MLLGQDSFPPAKINLPTLSNSTNNMLHRLITTSTVRASRSYTARSCAASASPTAASVHQFQHLLARRSWPSSASQLTPTQQRPFSSSHDDFSPQKKHNLDGEGSDNESKILDLIDGHVKGNKVMLYMKGSPAQPMCGFSATVVQILKSQGVDFASVNVLDYPEVREGVKKYAQWPTIPQLYVEGEFVGGCDIIKDLHESGELGELLGVEKKE